MNWFKKLAQEEVPPELQWIRDKAERGEKIDREESEGIINIIKNFYNELVDMDKNDKITRQSRANFYKKIGEFEI